jgi:hypothetical protein
MLASLVPPACKKRPFACMPLLNGGCGDAGVVHKEQPGPCLSIHVQCLPGAYSTVPVRCR